MISDWHKITSSLSSIGPAVAYVGFSMGAIFGFSTVASMPSMEAAAFVAGGIPSGGGIDDPPLRQHLIDAARRLDTTPVLMQNKLGDHIFSVDDSHELFNEVAGEGNRLVFSDGDHDDWPAALIGESIDFINQNIS